MADFDERTPQQAAGAAMKIALLDDYQGVAVGLADWASLGPDFTVEAFSRHMASEDELAATVADFDILCLMRERTVVSRTLMERLPKLKLVTVTGGRFRCVDLKAAAERGITVCSTGGGDAGSAVELAMGLILATARRIPQEDRNLRAGGWQKGLGMLLEGSTLGVLGLGRLGGKMAKYGHAFGMEVVAWSPNLTQERAAEHGAALLERDAFFTRSDVISIHMVLSPTTRGIVGARELSLMKPSAILVNTSRAPLVDQAALIEALQAGRIGGAGLDVFEQEPLPADHPLKRLDNTVLTPHIGFVNERSYRSYYAATLATVKAWRSGAPTGVQLP